MQVAIIGPNLKDQSKGSFHVHAAGCNHAGRKEYRRKDLQADFARVTEYETVQALVEDVYADQIAESDGSFTEYETDFWFADCILPMLPKPAKSDRAPYTLYPEGVHLKKLVTEDGLAFENGAHGAFFTNEAGEVVDLGLVHRVGDVENPRWFVTPNPEVFESFQEVKKTLWTRKEAITALVEQFNGLSA